jgi:S-adenosylmethionine uptake transporter
MPALHPKPTIPFLVAAIGVALFAVMDAAMKHLVQEEGVYTAALVRNIIGAIIAGAVFLFTRQRWPTAPVMRLHFLRSVIVAGMAITFFWGLARLPMAEAIGISFIAPVIALYLAAVLLNETISRAAIIGSAFGVGGMAIMINEKLNGDYAPDALWGVAAVLVSAVLFAYNLILARKQAQQANPIEITFFQSLLTAAVLSLGAPKYLETPNIALWPYYLSAAVLALCSLGLLSWAYARAEAQVLIPVEYTGFIWAAILGAAFFGEALLWSTIIGTALIVIGSVQAARMKG